MSFMSFTSPAGVGSSAGLGLGGRKLGWERGQLVLAGTSPGSPERNGAGADEPLPPPDAPGLAALLGALKAPGPQRAGPAELLGQLQLAGGLGEVEVGYRRHAWQRSPKRDE